MAAQEALREEGDTAGEASKEELGRGGGGVSALILDRLVRANLVSAHLHPDPVAAFVHGADRRHPGFHFR